MITWHNLKTLSEEEILDLLHSSILTLTNIIYFLPETLLCTGGTYFYPVLYKFSRTESVTDINANVQVTCSSETATAPTESTYRRALEAIVQLDLFQESLNQGRHG